tara:strand:- start:277 stop:1743 length:1467 start_codon:yes stop_codon:yes gene_type:complete
MKLLRSFFSQTMYYGFSSVLARLLGFLLVPLYMSYFPTGEYGKVTIFYSVITFFAIVFSLGMESAFFRFINQETDKKKVYSTTAIILFFSSIIVLLIGQIALQIFPEKSVYFEYIVWLFLITSIDTLCVLPFAKLRQQEKARKFAIIKTINIILNLSLNIFFIVLCPYLLSQNPETFDWINMLYNSQIGIGYIFISNLIASGVTLLLLFPVVYNKISLLDFSLSLTKKMFKYSFPLIIAGLAYATNEVLDKLLIGYFLGSEEAGIYGAAYKLSIFMVLFVQAYRYAVEPYYFNNFKKPNFKNNYIDIMRYYVIFASLIFLTISLNIDYIMDFLLLYSPYAQDYKKGLEIIPIVLLAHLFLGIYYNLSMWYKLTNKTYYGAVISVMGAIITISLNFILIPKIGYIGSAWATLICYFFMTMVSYILSTRFYYIPYEKMKTSMYLTIAVLIYICANYFEIKSMLYNLILIVLYICLVVFLEKLKTNKNEIH